MTAFAFYNGVADVYVSVFKVYVFPAETTYLRAAQTIYLSTSQCKHIAVNALKNIINIAARELHTVLQCLPVCVGINF